MMQACTFSFLAKGDQVRTALGSSDEVFVKLEYNPGAANAGNQAGLGNVTVSLDPRPDYKFLGDANRAKLYYLNKADAMSYPGNPRNLEHMWKPPFRIVFEDVVAPLLWHCTVHEEAHFWSHDNVANNPDVNELESTFRLPQDTSKSVMPDISILLRKFDDAGRVLHRHFPVIVELKRAISRSMTYRGFPRQDNAMVFDRAVEALLRLLEKAMRQSEIAAMVQFERNPNQHDVILVATAGPWFTVTHVDRHEIKQEYGQPRDELNDLYNRLRADIDPEVQDVANEADDLAPPPNAHEIFDSWPTRFLNRIDTATKNWAQPTMLDTPYAQSIWMEMRECMLFMAHGPTGSLLPPKPRPQPGM